MQRMWVHSSARGNRSSTQHIPQCQQDTFVYQAWEHRHTHTHKHMEKAARNDEGESAVCIVYSTLWVILLIYLTQHYKKIPNLRTITLNSSLPCSSLPVNSQQASHYLPPRQQFPDSLSETSLLMQASPLMTVGSGGRSGPLLCRGIPPFVSCRAHGWKILFQMLGGNLCAVMFFDSVQLLFTEWGCSSSQNHHWQAVPACDSLFCFPAPASKINFPSLTNTTDHQTKMSERGRWRSARFPRRSPNKVTAMPVDHKHCTCKSIRSRCDLFLSGCEKIPMFSEHFYNVQSEYTEPERQSKGLIRAAVAQVVEWVVHQREGQWVDPSLPRSASKTLKSAAHRCTIWMCVNVNCTEKTFEGPLIYQMN